MKIKTIIGKKTCAFGVALIFSLFSRQIVFADGWDVAELVDLDFGIPFEATIFDIIEGILYWLLTLLGIVAVIAFVVSGLMYLTAYGDEKKVGSAKKAMNYAVIGIITALSGLIAIFAVDTMLRGVEFF